MTFGQGGVERAFVRLMRGFSALALLGCAGFVVACDGPDSPAMMVREHLIIDSTTTPSGYECSTPRGGSSASGTAGEDEFWTRTETGENGMTITAGSFSETLVHREFDIAFFESGRMERFVIEAPDGQRWSYMVWGAEECEECPAESYVALPGDISGCGLAADAGAPDAE